jgi:serpin B
MEDLMQEKKLIMIFRKLFLTGLFLPALAGCGLRDLVPSGGGSSQIVESKLPRAETGDIPIQDLEKLAGDNMAFALDLYQQLRSDEGNLFYSPYSISAALAMTHAGARGDTAEEMAAVLQFHFPQESLHPAFNALDQHLENLAEMDIPDDQGDPFQLNIANALWGQQDFHFEEAFLDLLAENYGAGLRLLDYIQKPEESRQIINQWISDQTEDKIQDLIPQGSITPDTRLVLSNAIYFKATWLEPFEKEQTEEGIFYGLDGQEIPVQMMRHGTETSFRYFQGQTFQAVELPYIGGQVSMLVLMPDEGEFGDFEAVLSNLTLNTILDEMSYTPLKLTFPKFEYEAEHSLAGILSEMGMPTAFGGRADFSGMTGAKELFISDVFHKAYVNVDEEGTEAAAATAVLMKLTAMPENPIELTVDRPFLFFIRDHETNSILFAGRVVNPQ